MTGSADTRTIRRRANLRSGVAAVVTGLATIVVLALLFPDAEGRSIFVAAAAFSRQPWLIVAAGIVVGCAAGGVVYTRSTTPARAR